MVQEFWLDTSGGNLLRGVEGDADNPPRLDAATITDFLRSIPRARASFNTLYPSMLPEERARLDGIARAAKFLEMDSQSFEDAVQHKVNTSRVIPRGPGPTGWRRVG